MRWRAKLFADDIAEEFCFVCKDGGNDLRVCDFKNCLKSYHARCVGKEEDFLSSTDHFVCDWHKCVKCKRSSSYQCLCCPNSSACGDCLRKDEFVQVKESSKGFCKNCLKMALVVEKIADADSEWAMVDFRGTENYELCFTDYWEVIKGKERLTPLDLREARIILKRSLKGKEARVPEKSPDELDDTDGDVSGAEQTCLLDKVEGSNEVQASLRKRRSNKKTYVGWGSQELIKFLSCIGRDTTKPLDDFGVAEVVREYIQQKNLFQDKKKKSFICDDNLHSLFRRRKLNYKAVRNLLEVHLASNADSEDESLDGSQDNSVSTTNKKPRNNLEPKIPTRISEINKSSFASLSQNNLKLIYLRRNLVTKLVVHPDTFEQKVVGCLVRVKRNYKKPYQLGIVTGVKKSSEDYQIKDARTDILLCVSSVLDDVKISMLSEEDFDEDECNDLRASAKKELFKRPTVAELEEKAAIVHADIVNHWIDMELLRLDKEIERAHEKGWRPEKASLIKQKELLSIPAERQRRLAEVPEVIPDTEERKENEFEAAASNSFQGNIGATEQVVDSLKVVMEESSEGVISEEATGSLEIVMEESPEEQVADPLKVIVHESPEGASERDDATCEVASEVLGTTQAIHMDNSKDEDGSGHRNTGDRVVIIVDSDDDEGPPPERRELGRAAHGARETTNGIYAHTYREPEAVNVITVPTAKGLTAPAHRASEAATATTVPTANGIAAPAHRPSEAMVPIAGAIQTDLWYYADPQGCVQGPYPMAAMRKWQGGGFFPPNFKVWAKGQTMDQSILLETAMQMKL